MLLQLKQFVNNLNKPKNWLLLVNVLLVLFLIICNNLGIIPLRTGDFIFFAILTLFLALYRPGWAFLFFIGTTPLENINLAPVELGIAIRPYQFIGALTITAIIIRLMTGKLNFNLIKLGWHDWLIVVIGISSFLSIINAENKIISLKLSIILVTFVALYFLVRNYVQNLEDLKKIIPFFLSSSLVVVIYGIWQNIWFLRGLNGFEVMPGRPSLTFTEPDWAGIFLVLAISVVYILIYYSVIARESRDDRGNLEFNKSVLDIKGLLPASPAGGRFARNDIGLVIFLILSYILLILTVSRSAWLGAISSTIIFLLIIFTNLKLKFSEWQWKKTIQIKLVIISALAIAIGSVYIFHLTNFQLFNRIQSTGSGMQKITISCDKNINLPESINNVSELKEYSCRHINLEEINFEKSRGNYVAEIYRKDPNVSIRAEIYQKSWHEIKNHWILGIGWGNISKILGNDERGTPLNSSNIFLEIWLGSGILGFASFVIVLAYILVGAIRKYYFVKNQEEKIFALFVIISCAGIITANFFNAGIFLGFLWVWIAIAQVKNSK